MHRELLDLSDQEFLLCMRKYLCGREKEKKRYGRIRSIVTDFGHIKETETEREKGGEGIKRVCRLEISVQVDEG